MATSPAITTSSFLSNRNLTIPHQNQLLFQSPYHGGKKTSSPNHVAFKIQAAKLPAAGVVMPKVEPTFKPPFLGFTKTAETWNSRACMIGLIGTFIVELILNKGILQIIGLEIGKGIDIPL